MDHPRSRGDDMAARRNPGRLGVGLARGWSRPSPVRSRRQPVRRRTAPRDRRRARRCRHGSCACVRRRDLCGAGSDARAHRHRHDGRRPQGIAYPPRAAPREARAARKRGGADRRRGTVRRAGALRPVRPPRDSCRGGGRVRRSAFPAPAAGCPIPSAGTRGAARTCSCTGTGSCAHAAFDVTGTAGRGSAAGTRSRTAAGSLLCSGAERASVCARGEGRSSASGGGRAGTREPGRAADDRSRRAGDLRGSGAGKRRVIGALVGPGPVGPRDLEEASAVFGIRLACVCPVEDCERDRRCDRARARARLLGGCRTPGRPPACDGRRARRPWPAGRGWTRSPAGAVGACCSLAARLRRSRRRPGPEEAAPYDSRP